jgi:hypothetical protein
VVGLQAGFEFFRQLACLDMVAAKAFDPAAEHFADMEEVSAGRYDLVKNRIQVPVVAAQAVVLGFVLAWRTSARLHGVVKWSLHGLLLSIDPIESIAAVWLVLIGVAVLVLLSAAATGFHAQVCGFVFAVGKLRF